MEAIIVHPVAFNCSPSPQNGGRSTASLGPSCYLGVLSRISYGDDRDVETSGLDKAARTAAALAGIELEPGIGKGFLVPGQER
jgi:hypothetical protein